MNKGLGITKGSHESPCPSAIQTDEDYSVDSYRVHADELSVTLVKAKELQV